MVENQNIERKNNPSMPVWGRIIAIIFTYLILGGISQYIGSVITGFPIDPKQTLTLNQFLILVSFDLPVLLLIVYIFRRYIDKKSIQSMGFAIRNRYKDLFLGFIIAVFIIGVGTITLYYTNNIEIGSIKIDQTVLLKNFILFLAISLNEEILMRGYILNNLMSSMNKYLALVVSALLFCSFHLLNSNISFLSMLNLFLAGVLLGSTYIFTKNIWLPISLHLFWNFIQGPVFGYNVSGEKTESILTLLYNEKNIINGGDFGFEGSIICTILSIIFIAIILGYNIRKGNNL